MHPNHPESGIRTDACVYALKFGKSWSGLGLTRLWPISHHGGIIGAQYGHGWHGRSHIGLGLKSTFVRSVSSCSRIMVVTSMTSTCSHDWHLEVSMPTSLYVNSPKTCRFTMPYFRKLAIVLLPVVFIFSCMHLHVECCNLLWSYGVLNSSVHIGPPSR